MKSAGEYAASLLMRRKYSEKELRTKLLQKKYSHEEIEDIVAYFKNNGSIDDADYAVRFIHDARRLKGYGRIRIERDLKARGISEEEIFYAFSADDFDEKDMIKKYIEKNKESEQEAIIRRLMYRGFGYDDIKEVWSSIYG